MLKKLILAAVACFCMLFSAVLWAAVDVNHADQAALNGIKGIGPSLSKTILAERSQGGIFKDWPDLEKRVKGISAKKSLKLSSEGLVVNGKSKDAAPAPARKPTSKAGKQ